FVDAAIPFIKKAVTADKPFYLNLWPDDVHSPFWPPTANWGDGSKRRLYLSVLEAMDQQLGKLFAFVRKHPKLSGNTLIMVCSDNGPEKGAGVAGPFRGFKTHLFEGGVRSSLVAWAPELMDGDSLGSVNRESVFSAIDLVPTLLDLAGVSFPPGISFDGESLPEVLLGKTRASRKKALFFRRPPDRDSFYGVSDLPDLAMRSGKWKLLCEYDGSDPLLYDMEKDRGETVNLAGKHPRIVKRLSEQVIGWHNSMPPDNGPALSNQRVKVR
ncbi:MAG: sulfatase-like hydrolase/transferase, partial [Verrucomicrobiota bacterium]|nr:sulfatase-like hydrolase/transferase [Verrucomicrobiota bacterium]